MTRLPSERRTASNERLHFVSWSRLRNRTTGERPSSAMARFRACSGHPRRVRLRGRGAEEDLSAAELDEHEEVERPEPGRLDGAEVARDDPVRLPGGTRSTLGRSVVGRDPLGPFGAGSGSRRADANAELPKLASDPDTAPSGVLPGEPEAERRGSQDRSVAGRADRSCARSVSASRARAASGGGSLGRRGRRPSADAGSRDWPPRAGPGRRSGAAVGPPSAEHPELIAEDEDLEVPGSVGSTTPAAGEEMDEGPDDEVEVRPHRPIVLGGPIANLGF